MFGLFGWGWKVRRLRKRWDRLREKALGKAEPMRRTALEKLDSIHSSLIMLEEKPLGKIDRIRIAKEVEIGLAEVKEILKARAEELKEEVKT